MTLYYFETHGVNPWMEDAGLELADLDAAWCEAVRFFGESIRRMDASIWAEPSFQVNVRDAERRCVTTLSVIASSSLHGDYEEVLERAA